MSLLFCFATALAQSPASAAPVDGVTPPMAPVDAAPPVAPAAPVEGAAPPATPGSPGILDESKLIPGIPPGPPPPAGEVQNIAYAIGVKLRCPVCQGLSVADSTSAAAVQMQMRIRELVAAGYSEEQIRAYFIERYGEWIVLDPEVKGLNLLIWIGPGLLAGLGLAWAASLTVKWRKEEDDVPLPSDVGLVPKDRYEQRLLAELED
jgi:cytochrome c-type biogenesis protein CcmH/NrfF